MNQFGQNDVAPAGVSPCEECPSGEPGGGAAASASPPPAGGTAPESGSKLPASSTDEHWIQIELVYDDDGSPVAEEEYLIVLPDGDEIRGYTDSNGTARIERLESGGSAKVSFPNLHKDEWERA